MKIVFSAGVCEKTLHVTTKLLYAICRVLSQKGHQCYIVGYSAEGNSRDVDPSGVEFIRFTTTAPITAAFRHYEAYCKENAGSDSGRSSYIWRHPLKSLLTRLHYMQAYQWGYGRSVSRIAKALQADAVICLQDPIWAVQDVLKHLKHFDGSKCIYQVDPWGLFDRDKVVGNPRNPEDETAALAQVDWLFTTPVLYGAYRAHEAYRPFAEKMIPLDFPNLEQRDTEETSAISFDGNRINLLFCGSIQGEYRDPQPFLELMCNMLEDGSPLCCHFMGDVDLQFIQPYRERYPDAIVCHESVTLDRAYATMKAADVLLNIGNAYSNMVPSKIFDYFSLGKPIINLQKLENCPARPYFDRYPLCISLEQWHIQDYLMPLRAFLTEFVGKSLEYEKVEQIFNSSTPAFVADELEKALLQCRKNGK